MTTAPCVASSTGSVDDLLHRYLSSKCYPRVAPLSSNIINKEYQYMMIPVKTNTSSQRMLLQTIRSVSEMHLFGKIVLYSNLVQCQSCLGPF